MWDVIHSHSFIFPPSLPPSHPPSSSLPHFLSRFGRGCNNSLHHHNFWKSSSENMGFDLYNNTFSNFSLLNWTCLLPQKKKIMQAYHFGWAAQKTPPLQAGQEARWGALGRFLPFSQRPQSENPERREWSRGRELLGGYSISQWGKNGICGTFLHCERQHPGSLLGKCQQPRVVPQLLWQWRTAFMHVNKTAFTWTQEGGKMQNPFHCPLSHNHRKLVVL